MTTEEYRAAYRLARAEISDFTDLDYRTIDQRIAALLTKEGYYTGPKQAFHSAQPRHWLNVAECWVDALTDRHGAIGA